MAKEKVWCIYMHKNKENGKMYIGQTYTSLQHRFGKNGIRYNQCTLFWNAIKKYGWDNFEHIILEDGIQSQSEANEKEKYYIKKYKTTDRKYGYNLQDGGSEQTVLSIKVYQYDLDGNYIGEYNSISDAMRDNNISNGKISDCCKGKRKSIGGYMWSYDKVSKLESYRRKSKSKPVYQYSLDGDFIRKYYTVTEASKIANCNASKITSCCNLTVKTVGGYQWRYDYCDNIGAIKNKTRMQTHNTEILQIDNNGNVICKFSSPSEASLLFDNSENAYASITNCLLHKSKSACGYIWLYNNEFNNFSIDDYIAYSSHMREILQYDLNKKYLKTFKSISDASKEVNGATGNISRCCSGKYKTAYGYIWKYAS